MSLNSSQAMVTVQVDYRKFAEVPEKLARALEPYPNARIITVTQSIDKTLDLYVLAVVEYDPGGPDL